MKDAFHDPSDVMLEVQRLNGLGLAEAVQAIVTGTSKIAAGHEARSAAIDELHAGFAAAMSGVTFFEIDDTPRAENQRYRKALFVAACASLAAEARARADDKGNGNDSPYVTTKHVKLES